MDTNIFSALFGQVWNQPASLLVIAALSILAYLLEIWPQFPSRFIPHIIVLVGAVVYPFFANRSSVPSGYPNPMAVLVVNGFISGFLSTIMHATLIKFLINKFGATPPPVQLAGSMASATPEVQPPVAGGVPPALPVMFACAVLTLLLVGCGSVKYAEGADPLVVQTEALESRAQNAFDLILHADNGNRPFFQTNAPGFHGACEWLRTPISYHGTAMIARAQCIILQLDDVKNDYKASRANSNQLSAASSVLESSLSQVQLWLPTIVGNNPAK